MGRPRSFDETEAIAAASTVFRERGYAATSVDHLVAATGVHRGSLYGVFGSKLGLFARVVDAAIETDDAQARLDIALVALMDVAAAQERIAQKVQALIRAHNISAADLGHRVLSRARLTDEGR